MRRLIPILLAAVLLLGLSACAPAAKEPAPPSDSAGTPSGAPGEPSGDKILRVGMECAYAPYNWTQPDDSNGAVPIFGSKDYAYGYDVMIAKYLADKIGYTLEIHKLDWDSLPIAVQSGAIDCAIAGQSIKAERMEVVDFTTPYYYASIVVLTKSGSPFADAKGLSGLAGATSTSQINTVWYDVCLPQIENVNALPAMDQTSAMLVSLDSGNCDLLVTDAPTAMAAVMVYPDMVVLDFTGLEDNFVVSDEEINIGISVRKGNSELLNLLNEALTGLTTDDFEAMMNDAIAVQPLNT